MWRWRATLSNYSEGRLDGQVGNFGRTPGNLLLFATSGMGSLKTTMSEELIRVFSACFHLIEYCTHPY